MPTDGSLNETVRQSHAIYIGGKIERAVEIIGEESEDLNGWELVNEHADGELKPDVELRGNYLHVTVETETDDD